MIGFIGIRGDTGRICVLNWKNQREEVVQTMPSEQYGTLEVVGR